MFSKIKKFLEETKQELRHVNWPTGREAARLTAIVIVVSLVVAFFLGAFDNLFTYLLKVFVLKS